MATETLNCLLDTASIKFLYTTKEGVPMGPMLYGDGNLTHVALTDASRLQPILSPYNEYT
jgi:hypothetical protein